MGSQKSKPKQVVPRKSTEVHANPQTRRSTTRRSSVSISTDRNLVFNHSPDKIHIENPPNSNPMLIDLNNEIDETEYAKLERVQCHKERIRRRESLVPTVLSIVEDPFLELLCEDTGQEPDHAADRLSRNDRKRLVSSVSLSMKSEMKRKTFSETLHNVRESENIISDDLVEEDPVLQSKDPNIQESNRVSKASIPRTSESKKSSDNEIRKSQLSCLMMSSNSKPEALQEYFDSSHRKSKFGMNNPNRINSAKSSIQTKTSSKTLTSRNPSSLYYHDNLENDFYKEQEELTNDVSKSDSVTCQAEDLENARLEHFRRSTLNNIRKGSILPDTIGVGRIEDLNLAPHMTSPEGYFQNSETDINFVAYTASEHKIPRKTKPNIMTTIKSEDDSELERSQEMTSKSKESTQQLNSTHINEQLASRLNFEDLPSLHETFNQKRQSTASNMLDQRPKTSITGYSAYPLPGSELSTKHGGIYESTKCSRNLLSEREILQVISQTIATQDGTEENKENK